MHWKLAIVAGILVLAGARGVQARDGPPRSGAALSVESTEATSRGRPAPRQAHKEPYDFSLTNPFKIATWNRIMAAIIVIIVAVPIGFLIFAVFMSHRHARKRAAPYVLAELRAVLPDVAMTPAVKRALHPPIHRFSAIWALGWAMYRARASAFKLSKAQAEHTFQRQLDRRLSLARVMAGEAAAAMAMEAEPQTKPYWVVVVLVAARQWPWTRGQSEALATARRRMGSPFLQDVLLTEVIVFPHYCIPDLAAPKPKDKAPSKGKRLAKQAAVDVAEQDDEDDDPDDDKA